MSRGGGLPKINMETANEIRFKHARGVRIKDLAREYCLSIPSVWRICNNLTWAARATMRHRAKK